MYYYSWIAFDYASINEYACMLALKLFSPILVYYRFFSDTHPTEAGLSVTSHLFMIPWVTVLGQLVHSYLWGPVFTGLYLHTSQKGQISKP